MAWMLTWGRSVFGLKLKSPKILVFKLLLVFIPVYTVAYLSQSMIYVLPTIAVFILFGANIQSDEDSADSPTSKEENEGDASD
jgi:hypothetical protein